MRSRCACAVREWRAVARVWRAVARVEEANGERCRWGRQHQCAGTHSGRARALALQATPRERAGR
eukprot:4644559-Prymnesium_polylepis.1